MNIYKRIVACALIVAAVMMGTNVSSAQADPGTDKAPNKGTWSTGEQGEKPKLMPHDESVMAKTEQPKGPYEFVATDENGKPKAKTPKAGNVSNIGFEAPYNYCDGWVYTPVKNDSANTKYLFLRLYLSEEGTYRDFYTSVSDASSVYSYFDGIEGSYSVSLFVWNGSTYVYDESMSNVNNCDVSIKIKKSSSGYVKLAIKNHGNAYAFVQSQEWESYSYGPKFDYPEIGGTTIYRNYYVGTANDYVITADMTGNSEENVPEDNGDDSGDSVIFNYDYDSTPA